ncbi:MAG: CDP-archaeol synthase [Verrucomicrobiota bacterium]
MFIKRFISSVAFISLISALVYFRLSTPTFVLVSVIALLAQWEFYALQEAKGLKLFKKAGVFSGALFFSVAYFNLVKPGVFGHLESVESFAILVVILGVLGRMVFEKERETPVATISLTLFGFFYIPYLLHFISRVIFTIPDQAVSAEPMRGILFAAYMIAVTKVTDIGAYLVGARIGKHKMSPVISPKKTWEGFVAGVLCGLLVSILAVKLLPESLGVLGFGHAIFLGVMLPLISVIGDLVESVIKRDADIKDSGGVIPGIGGCLDLIDSLLYTAPLFYFYLIFFVF